jgi:hypothetical protein
VSVVTGQARRRWWVVAGAVALLCLAPIAWAHRPFADPHADPAKLRALILASANQPYQGYAISTGALGLPALPQLGAVAGLLGGATSMRVWYAGPTNWRVATVDTAGESDVYRDADGTGLWDFKTGDYTRFAGDLPIRLPWASDLTPPALARRLLKLAAAGDRVTALPARRVAGRVAAGLRLTPHQADTHPDLPNVPLSPAVAGSTIGWIDIWADPSTGLPLQVDIGGRAAGLSPSASPSGAGQASASPAAATQVLGSRFLDVSLDRPVGADLDARPDSPATPSSRPDIVSILNSVARVRLPDELGGSWHRVVDDDAVRGVAAYGSGFGTFVVIPLPGRIGNQALDAMRDGGGVEDIIASRQAYVTTATVLTTLVVQADTPGDFVGAYLLAGFVRPAVLLDSASNLPGVG